MDEERMDGPEPGVEEIEQVLKEMAQDAPDIPHYGVPDFAEGAEGSGIPEDLPVAEEYTVAATEPDPEPEGEGDAAITFENPIEYSDCRDVAVAEPMTTHDASIVALGDNVRQVTNLIESVGRTLEAQNQRTMRLMERLEAVARALETLPEEADRGLEGLDAVEEAILAQRKPLEDMSERLASLPDAVQAMKDQQLATREIWNSATRAMANRMAFSAYQDRMRERTEEGRRRWRVLAGATLAIAAFFGGAMMTASDMGAGIRNGLAAVITADQPVLQADEGERTWRVIEVKKVEQQLPVAPAAPEEPLGTDEEAK